MVGDEITNLYTRGGAMRRFEKFKTIFNPKVIKLSKTIGVLTLSYMQ